MDEDISIINTNNRNEKIKNFFIQNKKKLVLGIIAILLVLISYFSLGEYKKKQKIEISDTYNSIIINYSKNNKEKTSKNLIELINKKDPTY